MTENEKKEKKETEKVETEKIEAQMKIMKKTLLVVIGIISLATLGVYITLSFNNQKFIVGLIMLTILVAAIAGFIVAIIGAFILLRKRKEFPLQVFGLLWLIFALPFVFFFAPLSKYHNQNQIVRDKKIVEILQITTWEDLRKIMILLPAEHKSEHSYLEKVLSIGWTNDKKSWKKIAIPCRRGNEYWYEATIGKLTLDQTDKKASFILFFDHAWNDYEETKEILFPDPNDPNSL